MQINIGVDTTKLERLVKLYPSASQGAVERFSEQAGRTVERFAKKQAPVITGMLRRSIFYIPYGGGSFPNFTGATKIDGGKVIAYANYAKNVHGAPYYINKGRRKETPFFTFALGDSKTQIQQYARAIIPNILKNIGN